jgi:hypothetical protein
MVKLLLISFFTAYFCCGFAQSNDTVFYSNNAVLMITTAVNDIDSVLVLNDENGKNILKNETVIHTFFDKKFGKKRLIKIDEKTLIEDYCVSEADTIYNYFQNADEFNLRLKQFYAYLEQNVIYPKNALKKGVQANVKVSLIIDSNGSITNVFPITKHEWGFEETLIRTIKEKKQFGFVMYKNKPIKHYIEIPFAFRIVNR